MLVHSGDHSRHTGPGHGHKFVAFCRVKERNYFVFCKIIPCVKVEIATKNQTSVFGFIAPDSKGRTANKGQVLKGMPYVMGAMKI